MDLRPRGMRKKKRRRMRETITRKKRTIWRRKRMMGAKTHTRIAVRKTVQNKRFGLIKMS